MDMKRISYQERHEQILEHAREIFAEKGLAGARTRDIANACGINEALLYKHFGSKEEIFRESILRVYAGLRDQWKLEAAERANGLDALQALVKAQLVFLTGNPSVGGSLLHAIALATDDMQAREIAKNWFLEHNMLILETVKRGMGDGSMDPDLVPERATMFLRGIVWIYMVEAILGLTGNRDEMLDLVEATINNRLARD